MPLGPGQAATIALRVCGVPGCVSVALTLSYQSAPDSLYGRELALPACGFGCWTTRLERRRWWARHHLRRGSMAGKATAQGS